jgi:hypothetical protein
MKASAINELTNENNKLQGKELDLLRRQWILCYRHRWS